MQIKCFSINVIGSTMNYMVNDQALDFSLIREKLKDCSTIQSIITQLNDLEDKNMITRFEIPCIYSFNNSPYLDDE